MSSSTLNKLLRGTTIEHPVPPPGEPVEEERRAPETPAVPSFMEVDEAELYDTVLCCTFEDDSE